MNVYTINKNKREKITVSKKFNGSHFICLGESGKQKTFEIKLNVKINKKPFTDAIFNFVTIARQMPTFSIQ